MRKVIFFQENNFSRNDYERFGIELLAKNGAEVEVWDFTKLLHPEYYLKTNNNNYPFRGYRLIESYRGFREMAKQLSALEDLVIFNINYNCNSAKLVRELSREGIRYCLLIVNAIPALNNSKFQRLKSKLVRLNWQNLINFIFRKIPINLLNIKPANFYLAGGKRSLISTPLYVEGWTEVMWIHSFDYDKFLIKKQTCQENIVVFLDEYLPLHPDYEMFNIIRPVDAEEYYKRITEFFTFIEKNYNTQVVVAEHPRSDYDNLPDYFKSRKRIKGQTLNLIRRSQFVLAHSSTSVGMAVLSQKPVIFLTMDSLEGKTEGMNIANYARELGKSVVNIDQPYNVDVIDKELSLIADYENYIENYIKLKDTPQKEFWDAFLEKMNYFK